MPPANPLGLSASATDLGLGTMLEDQVAGETAEQRKKRMLQQQQQSLMPPGTSPPGGGLASLALFGGLSGIR